MLAWEKNFYGVGDKNLNETKHIIIIFSKQTIENE